MKRIHFSNAIDNYIAYDTFESAVKLIMLSTKLDREIVLQIFTNIEHDIETVNTYRPPSAKKRIKVTTKTVGQLVYTEILNLRMRYPFNSSIAVYRLRQFNFKKHFEQI